jgi:hypothetical protein
MVHRAPSLGRRLEPRGDSFCFVREQCTARPRGDEIVQMLYSRSPADTLNPFIPGVSSIWLANDLRNYTAQMMGVTLAYRSK